MTNKEEFLKHFGIEEKQLDDDFFEDCFFDCGNVHGSIGNICKCPVVGFWGREYKPEVGNERTNSGLSDDTANKYKLLDSIHSRNDIMTLVINMLYRLSDKAEQEEIVDFMLMNLFAMLDSSFDAQPMLKTRDIIVNNYIKKGGNKDGT